MNAIRTGALSFVMVLAATVVADTPHLTAQQPEVRLRASQAPSPGAAPPITIAFDETSVGGVVGAFANHAGFSYVLGRGVGGTISADVRGVPWDVALDAILNAYGLRIVDGERGIMVVEHIATVRQRVEFVEPETRVFKVRYQDAADLLPALQSVLTDRGRIAVAESTNSLVVTDIPEILDRIGRILWGE